MCYPVNRYKLEKALLEKDATIEKLERNIYKLKAEMRMIVKENEKLTRKVATLNEDSYRENNPYREPSPYPETSTRRDSPSSISPIGN